MAALPGKHSLCLSSAYYPPHMGGVETFTQSIARELVARGHDVCVVTNSPASDDAATGDDGVEVVRLPADDPIGRFPLLRHDGESERTWKSFASRDFDAYVVNTRFYPLSLKMLSHARRKGKRPILIEHGSAYVRAGNPVVDAGIRCYENAIGPRIRALDPACYGVSREACAWMGNFGLKAQGTIHNSIDVDTFLAAASSRDFRAQENIPPDACLVAFTGRIVPEKGIWTIVDVARRLERRPFYFLMAGDGPQLPALLERKPSNMKALGRLSRADIAALLAQADAFCFPSVSEGLSTSLLEAACSRAYIIATPVGGTSEMVPGPEYGCIVQEASADAFTEALTDAWSQRERMRECAHRCALLVAHEFSWRKSADDLLAACGFES